MGRFGIVRIWVLVFVMLARLGQRTGGYLVLLLGLKPTPDRTVERDPEIHGGGRRFQTLWSHRHKLEPSPSTQAQPSFPLSPEFFLWQFYRITISLGPLRHREMGFWEVLSFLPQLALNLSDPSPTTQWPSSATSGASVVTGKE